MISDRQIISASTSSSFLCYIFFLFFLPANFFLSLSFFVSFLLSLRACWEFLVEHGEFVERLWFFSDCFSLFSSPSACTIIWLVFVGWFGSLEEGLVCFSGGWHPHRHSLFQSDTGCRFNLTHQCRWRRFSCL